MGIFPSIASDNIDPPVRSIDRLLHPHRRSLPCRRQVVVIATNDTPPNAIADERCRWLDARHRAIALATTRRRGFRVLLAGRSRQLDWIDGHVSAHSTFSHP